MKKVKVLYLASDEADASIFRPSDREAFASELYGSSTDLTSYVPEAACSITRNRGELSFQYRIKGHPLNDSAMSSELRAVFDLRFLGIPDAERSIDRAGGDEMTGRIPGHTSNAEEASELAQKAGIDRIDRKEEEDECCFRR